jgi:hypothetical protein
MLYCTDGVAAVTDADQIQTLLKIFNNEACGMKLPLLSLSSAAPMGREEDAAPHNFLVGCVWSSCFTWGVYAALLGRAHHVRARGQVKRMQTSERSESHGKVECRSCVHVRIQQFRALFGRLGKTETKAPAFFLSQRSRGSSTGPRWRLWRGAWTSRQTFLRCVVMG